jgi:hypothetical protein
MTAARQVAALLALRWQMLRSPRRRLAVAVAAVAGVAVVVLAASQAATLSAALPAVGPDALPLLLLVFVVVVLVGGVASGGGTEIVPSSHLVAFPVSAAAVFTASVVVSPLNFAWVMLVLGLVWVVAAAAPPDPLLAGGLLAGYVLVATVLALAASWWIVAVRATRRGRRATAALGLLLAGVGVAMALGGSLDEAVGASPLASVDTVLTQPTGVGVASLVATLALAVAVAVPLGARGTRAALARRDIAALPEGRALPRRNLPGRELWAVLAIDRAGVRRSAPIRRGLVLMVAGPGVAALVGGATWADLVIVPPLVAVGAALLFGINVMSLDGGGGLWLESTPRDVDMALLAKAWVTGEVVLLAVVATLLVVTVRLGPPPSASVAAAVGASGLVGVCLAVAVALRRSLRAPFKADLRSLRDAPAPPGAMLATALRLSLVAVVPAVLFGVAVRLPGVGVTAMVTALLLLATGGHLWRTRRLWRDPALRSSVVAKISLG